MTIGSHQKTVGKNQERFTPQWIFGSLGTFDTDAATSAVRPWTIGKYRNITPAENCLTMDWRGFGRTWCNPPFLRYAVGDFVRKMIEHDHGTLLLHVRTETEWFRPLFDHATALLFLAKRVIFCKRDGSPCTIENPDAIHYGKKANSGAPVVLAAFGFNDADMLEQFHVTGPIEDRETGILRGSFLPLRYQRFVVLGSIDETEAAKSWRAIVADWLRCQSGPVTVGDLYRAYQAHPKAKRNPHWKAKLRQTLQRGAGRSIGRDQWVAA